MVPGMAAWPLRSGTTTLQLAGCVHPRAFKVPWHAGYKRAGRETCLQATAARSRGRPSLTSTRSPDPLDEVLRQHALVTGETPSGRGLDDLLCVGDPFEVLPLSSKRKVVTARIKAADNVDKLARIFEVHRSYMSAVNLAALLSRMPHLSPDGLATRSLDVAALMEGALGQLAGCIADCRPRELSNVLWAVAKLGGDPGTALVPELCAAAEASIPDFNAQASPAS